MSQITPKFIYLDVGGVAIVDFSGNDKWNQMMSELGILGPKQEQFKKLWKEGESKLCVGNNNTEELAREIAKKIGFEIDPGYKMLDDFVARFEKNTGLCTLLDQIKDRFRFGLLTNMYPGMLDQIIEAKLLPDVKWDMVVDSTSVKRQKPNEDIYKYAQQLLNVMPEEILFVDNSERNLEVPKELGWQTVLYNSANTQVANSNLLKLLL